MSIENSCVRLDEGRWNPKNREVLEKLIEKYRNRRENDWLTDGEDRDIIAWINAQGC